MTIVGHHSLEIKPELKDYLSSHYPWPAKIVGYTEQHVQELSDDLKVSSSTRHHRLCRLLLLLTPSLPISSQSPFA